MFVGLFAASPIAFILVNSFNWGILRRITLPLLSPAILTVTIAGLIRSLEAFEIEQLLGTPAGIDVYSTRIFEMVSWERPAFLRRWP